MGGFLHDLLDTTSLMPHGQSYLWKPEILWLHVVSDVVAASSYGVVFLALVHFARKRRSPAPGFAFHLFGLFVLACGATHLTGVWTTWHAAYRFEGVAKAVTAALSVTTAVMLWPLIPRALAIPGSRAPTDVNRTLEERSRELERSNEDLERFAYAASHDLRAPLRAIGNLAEWLEEDLGDSLPEASREHLTLLRGRAARLSRLIEDLLEYSRVGRESSKTSRVDTAQLVRDVVGMLDPPADFEVVIPEDLPVFETAETPLRHVFTNLIGNAIKHHDRPDGRIEVTAKDAGAFYEFCARDDGPGIPPELRERAFEVFRTLRPRDEVEGSGLGLALVRRIVEGRGGSIHIEAAGARGACLCFTWRKQIEEEEIEAEAPAA